MKYAVIIGDGMAGRPLEELQGQTTLQYAATPNMDALAREGVVGMVRTIPPGFHPGSDVANLSILGYDPSLSYTGRAPLEAASIGVELLPEDAAYRCNLVTLSGQGEYEALVMDDYSCGHISTDEAKELILLIARELETDEVRFHPGVSYRHLMVWKNGSIEPDCTPPHDILGKKIAGYLPKGEESGFLLGMMKRSAVFFKGLPANARRKDEGKKPASSIWFWGQGKRPVLAPYREKYGISGALISAVDLTKGLGVYAGFHILQVPGVTGWIDTNYEGKAVAALRALDDRDFVYIHIEAPDEAGHSGNYSYKIKAIEDFDARVVGPVVKGLKEKFRDFRVLLMPDHATPVAVRTHTPEPVPFILYDSRRPSQNDIAGYDESIALRNGIPVFEKGHELMDHFIKEGL